MRMIILILILINVAFFSWAREHNFNEVLLENPKTVPGYSPIRLLSELNRVPSPVQKKVVAETQVSEEVALVVKPVVNKCFAFGPFDTELASNDAYEALFAIGIQAKQRTVEERQPKSYWVYLPPYESLAAAEKVTVFLKRNNINEFYIWLDPPLKNAVSLGLFTNLNTARSKISQAKKLDLNPEMEVRFNEITEYWVDFKRNQDDPQPELLEEMLTKNDRLLVLETKCL